VYSPRMLFTGARNGRKTLRHLSDPFRRLRGRVSTFATEQSGECSAMRSLPLAKLVGALRGTRAYHANDGATLAKPAMGSISRGPLSDRARLAIRKPSEEAFSGSRGLWTGGARDTALDAGRRLISSSGGSWAVLEARAVRPASLAVPTRGMKIKIKPYSSWKRRFQVTATGKFKRKQKGKRHKAFSKSPERRARLRGDRLVHETLVKPMKKLGFKLR